MFIHTWTRARYMENGNDENNRVAHTGLHAKVNAHAFSKLIAIITAGSGRRALNRGFLL